MLCNIPIVVLGLDKVSMEERNAVRLRVFNTFINKMETITTKQMHSSNILEPDNLDLVNNLMTLLIKIWTIIKILTTQHNRLFC